MAFVVNIYALPHVHMDSTSIFIKVRCFLWLDMIIWWCYFWRYVFVSLANGMRLQSESTTFLSVLIQMVSNAMHVWHLFLVDCQLSRAHRRLPIAIFHIIFGISISFISCERFTGHLFTANCGVVVAVGTKSRKCLLSLLLDTIGTQHIANRSFWYVCLHSHFSGNAQ